MIKNINNLQIELGAIAIKVFFVDLMNDLLINGLNRSLSSEKKDKCVSIIRKFCESIDDMYGLRNQNLCQRLSELADKKDSFVSQKVFKLV